MSNTLHRQTWQRVPADDTEAQPLAAGLEHSSSAASAGASASRGSPRASALHGHHDRVNRSFFGHIRVMLMGHWVNAFTICVPIGVVAYALDLNPLLTFTANAIAIVPLSALLTDATERIAAKAGDTVGALLNISLGNIVELIILIALANDQIRIVQASILGSILVNLLLILGSALIASSVTDFEPAYNTVAGQLLACLLFVSVFVVLMPTAFDYTYEKHDSTSAATLRMSRISALLVLFIYILYIWHEMRQSPQPVEKDIPLSSTATTDSGHDDEEMQESEHMPLDHLTPATAAPGHRTIRFADESPEIPSQGPDLMGGEAGRRTSFNHGAGGHGAYHPRASAESLRSGPGMLNSFRPPSGPSRRERSLSLTSSRGGFHSRESSLGGGAGGEPRGYAHALRDYRTDLESTRRQASLSASHKPTNDMAPAVTVLVATSILMSICAECLVSTIDDVTHEGGLSEAAIGLIILPIVGNIAEYVTVVSVAARNKLDLAIAVAVGSGIQIALCVTPLTVLAGWLMHKDLALTFNFFETASLCGTVLLVNLLVLAESGSSVRTSGLKGALMCACYIVISLGAYLSPSSD